MHSDARYFPFGCLHYSAKIRRRSGLFAASYVAWFVAFSTYSLQIGAMGAVFFISLRQRLGLIAWPSAIVGALLDAFKLCRTVRTVRDALDHVHACGPALPVPVFG